MSRNPTQAPSFFSLRNVAETITASVAHVATQAFKTIVGHTTEEELKGIEVTVNKSGMFEVVGERVSAAAANFVSSLNNNAPAVRAALFSALVQVVSSSSTVSQSQTAEATKSESSSLVGSDDQLFTPGAIVGTVIAAIAVYRTLDEVVRGLNRAYQKVVFAKPTEADYEKAMNSERERYKAEVNTIEKDYETELAELNKKYAEIMQNAENQHEEIKNGLRKIRDTKTKGVVDRTGSAVPNPLARVEEKDVYQMEVPFSVGQGGVTTRQ